VPPDTTALENPAWHSLTGPHAHLGAVKGGAGRYPSDTSVFIGLEDETDKRCWDELAALIRPGEVAVNLNSVAPIPPGWRVEVMIDAVQMVAETLDPGPDAEAVVLTDADVPDMLALVKRTNPGPFLPRTITMGTWLGIRCEGALAAMAGERLHPPGFTEISGVCTDVAFRGRGLGTRLIRAVAAGIVARGETPFLHASADNVNAIRLYRELGFALRAHRKLAVLVKEG
jgi:ribosomal protein S18 acetylase RimI-like enzyme